MDLHPYLFFSKLFEAMGFDHFAHNYHVIYTWVVMIILFVLAWLATKSITLIPGKAQNFLEVLMDSLPLGRSPCLL